MIHSETYPAARPIYFCHSVSSLLFSFSFFPPLSHSASNQTTTIQLQQSKQRNQNQSNTLHKYQPLLETIQKLFRPFNDFSNPFKYASYRIFNTLQIHPSTPPIQSNTSKNHRNTPQHLQTTSIHRIIHSQFSASWVSENSSSAVLAVDTKKSAHYPLLGQ